MKRSYLLIFRFSLALFLVLALASIRAEADSEEMNFRLPESEKWVMDNGLTVLFLEDPELPLVKGKLLVKGGTFWDGDQETGVAEALGVLLRRGGAGQRSGEAFDAEVERLAGRMSSRFGREFGEMEFSCLSTDLEQVISLFADLVQRPRFEQKALEIWKGQKFASIKRRFDEPPKMAQLLFRRLLFGQTPYGRVILKQHLPKITRQKLFAAHQKYVKPDQAVFAVSGRVAKPELKRLIKIHFASWKPRTSALPPLPSLDYLPQPGVYFVEGAFEQATVMMGQQGIPRLGPDHHATLAFNEIFGRGGFSSLLVNRLRVKGGLAYQAFGSMVGEKKHGRNIIFFRTKAEAAGKAINAAVKVLQELQLAKISGRELDDTKEAMKNAFVFNFDTSSGAVERRALLQLLEYPDDYESRYLKNISSLTAFDVQRVARKYWNIAQFVIVVVGNKNAYNSIVSLVKDRDSLVAGFKIKAISFADLPRL